MTDLLTYHGKDIETCKYVLDTFENNVFYKDHLTIQQWVKASRDILNNIDIQSE